MLGANILACLVLAALGRDRFMGFWGVFFFSLLFTPVVGMIFLLLTGPDTRSRRGDGTR
jgi:hypothetical protein